MTTDAQEKHDGSDEAENQEGETRTAWHPMLVTVLERFVPSGWKVIPELLLNRLPQRVDIVIIRLEGTPTGLVRKLHSVFDHLRPHTLIEFKGPTDDLEAIDALTLVGYGCQYMALNKVLDPKEVRLMAVADRIPQVFVQQIERLGGRFVYMGNGLWQGQVAGLSLHGIALRDAYKTAQSEHLLYTFSKAFLKQPVVRELLDNEDVTVYYLLHQQVVQFRRDPRTMSLRDIKVAEKTLYDVLADELLPTLPVERRLKGLTPEQVFAEYSVEQRFTGLTVEQRFTGLTVEQRFTGLTVDEIINALPPEVQRKMRG